MYKFTAEEFDEWSEEHKLVSTVTGSVLLYLKDVKEFLEEHNG